MCGEIDEEAAVGQEIIERFAVMAEMLGLKPGEAAPGSAASGGAPGLATSADRAAYMEALFRAGLVRALSDATAADDEEKVDALAAQAVAFARLAGFLAGQLPPEADLFRSVIEAATQGYGEPQRLEREWRHAQDHAHGHSHDHDHDHHH
jgi:hypothetical protein